MNLLSEFGQENIVEGGYVETLLMPGEENIVRLDAEDEILIG